MISQVTSDWLKHKENCQQISFDTHYSTCSSLAGKNIKINAFMLIFELHIIIKKNVFNNLNIMKY